MNALENFRQEIKNQAKDLARYRGEIYLLHHNDTDGLTSGAILQKALQRERRTIRRYALEKPYPDVLDRIFGGSSSALVVLADFGSGMLPTLSQLNRDRHRILVLDHHLINDVRDPNVTLLNGLKLGLKNSQFSASALCYQFALALNPWNKDLAWLGALGALGDGFLEKNQLAGFNQEAWIEACRQGRCKGEFLFHLDRDVQYTELKNALDALGSIGYFTGGPDIAVKCLAEGIDQAFWILSDKYALQKATAFKELKLILKSPLRSEGRIQWFDSGENFAAFGVKTVGLFCEELLGSSLISGDRYLVGFQHLRDEIPGLGTFEFNQSKLSVRVPPELEGRIMAGAAKPITELLPAPLKQIGGFLDACHPTAGAATVPRGSEMELIRLLSEQAEYGSI